VHLSNLVRSSLWYSGKPEWGSH